jgi:Uri superfamily endonuclease
VGSREDFRIDLEGRYTSITLLIEGLCEPGRPSITVWNRANTCGKALVNTTKSQPCPMQDIQIESLAGSYVLLIALENAMSIAIGRLGLLAFKAGLYTYTGSAHGPGGLRGRIERHLRHAGLKKLHWHIDTLTTHAVIMEAWWATDPARLECQWAEMLAQIGIIEQPRFGASDCRCPGHLIYLGDDPLLQETWDVIEDTTPSKLQRWRNPSISISLEKRYGT